MTYVDKIYSVLEKISGYPLSFGGDTDMDTHGNGDIILSPSSVGDSTQIKFKANGSSTSYSNITIRQQNGHLYAYNASNNNVLFEVYDDGHISTPNGNINLSSNSLTNVAGMNGANISGAASGTVPTSNGSGGLSMQSPGSSNVPNWQEDGNSPTSVSGAASLSYTLASSYDIVNVVLHHVNGSDTSTGVYLKLTVNGDTSTDYNYTQAGGGTTNSQSYIPIEHDVPSNGGVSGSVIMSGTWGYKFAMRNLTTDNGGRASMALFGNNGNVTSPLSSFTLQWGSGSISTTARVYGLNV